MDTQSKGISLSEYTALIEREVNGKPSLRQWVTAELSDVRTSRGHCYMELLEKDAGGNTVAKIGGIIWSSIYGVLNHKFSRATGQSLATGMKVLVNVSANFHRQFGIKAIVNDIDPSYTIGDMARQRKEILDRLTAEGIIDDNKQLPWPDVPQRIAVISSPSAAGYGDFMDQLRRNAYRLQYYTCLFPALMQGTQTVPSVLAAIDRINAHIDLFDCVVIIRGGGATSELNSFDNYDLAAAVAQFPIPVIVGIGHDRDETVLDYVAAMRVKTPTAAAEWLIQRGTNALARLIEFQDDVTAAVRDKLGQAKEQMAYYTSMIPATAGRIVDANRLRLDNFARTIPMAATSLITVQRTRLDRNAERIGNAVTGLMQQEKQRLQALNDKAALLSPEGTLRRGYALVTRDGKCVTAAAALQPGDQVTVQFAAGTANATVNQIDNN